MMLRTVLIGLMVAGLAVMAPARMTWAFEPPTAADFFGRFILPDHLAMEVGDDGSVLLVSPPGFNGSTRFYLRPGETPAPGNRSISVDITVVQDGGGWPQSLVGMGFMHGYREDQADNTFSVGILSPQDGGTLRIGSTSGQGFGISQALGSDSMAVGETVRLTMTEQEGSVSFTASNGSSTQASVANDTVAAGMTEGSRIGFILVSGGVYRVSNLVIEESP